MRWSVELVIAIIGAVTGISGLLLQFFDYWKSRPNIEFDLDKDKRNFYFLNDGKTFRTNNNLKKSEIIAAIPILIRNKSVQPITIEKIEVIHPLANFPMPLEPRIMDNVLTYKLDHLKSVQISLGNTIELPHRIDGYDSLYGNIKPSWFNKDYLEDDKLKLTLRLITSKNVIEKKVSLAEFKYNNP